jgi:hypothetical protein
VNRRVAPAGEICLVKLCELACIFASDETAPVSTQHRAGQPAPAADHHGLGANTFAAVADVAESQTFRVGATLVVDVTKPACEYSITKNMDSETRRQRTAAFLQDEFAGPLRAQLLVPDRAGPLAALHSLADIGGSSPGSKRAVPGVPITQ